MKHLGATLVVLLTVVVCSGQTTSQKLSIRNAVNAPVEVVKVKINGGQLSPGDKIAPTLNWPSKLEVTVKNITEEPVSYVEVAVFSDRDNTLGVRAFNSFLTFGATKSYTPVFLQPNETVVLTHTFTAGDVFDFSEAQLELRSVYWNNDDSYFWHLGSKLRRRSDGDGYDIDRQPAAKYTFPKSFVPTVEYVKAAALPAPTPPNQYCTKIKSGTGKAQCDVACGFVPCEATYDRFTVPGPGMNCIDADCDTNIKQENRPCTKPPTCDYLACLAQDKEVQVWNVMCFPAGTDPVIVDVAGNGFSLTDFDSGVLFDYAAVGIRFKIAWTAPDSDDAFLALDRNGNGAIDDGSELFGDVTRQPRDSWVRNGFEALATLDSNQDGVIDKTDERFKDLLLWQDSNHNGISEPDELHKLKDSGLKVIDCHYKPARRTDQFGNQFRYRAKLKDTRDAQIGRWAFDVFLASRR
jgi:hypothetical protein